MKGLVILVGLGGKDNFSYCLGREFDGGNVISGCGAI